MAAQGLPASGRIGFEIFDRTAFGVTDFLEHVNYRRALEGELARTIGTIAEVSSARVHIAMARPSLFAGQDQAAKASVVLKLRSNKPLSASTTAAISGLVAAGVEGLRPEAVVIIDNFGRPLTRSTDGREEATGAFQVERQQRIERDLSARVVALLEPIVGAARVRVNVSAKLNADSQEETEERWDPMPVVRSHQTVVQSGTAAGAAQGVAGARANLPPPARRRSDAQAAAPRSARRLPAGAGSGDAHVGDHQLRGQQSSRPIAFSRKARSPSCRWPCCSTTIAPEGRARANRAATEIEKIHEVVAAAVGLDLERGDRLTVENIAFEEPIVEERRAAPLVAPLRPQLMLDAGRIVAVLLIALLVVFGVIRPTVRRTLGAVVVEGQRAIAAPQGPRTVADVQGELRADLDEDDGPTVPRRLPALTRRVSKMAQEEPENAARLVRSWLAEQER